MPIRISFYGLLLLAFSFLGGCSTLSAVPTSQNKVLPGLQTAYDFTLFDSATQKPVPLDELTRRLKEADVVFIGEFHGNHASHLLQAQLQNRLYQQRPEQILSMEQFERHQQNMLDRYLDSAIGEAYLINETPAWENYAGSYRPLVEFAKRRFLPVIAANAPGDIVRCIGRQGRVYPGKLNKTERKQVAAHPFAAIPGYREKFASWFGETRHGDDNRMQNSYLAQLARDNTMAESIVHALQRYPGHQVIHLNGTFHSESGLGTVAALKRMEPQLNIKVISPVQAEDPENPLVASKDFLKGDYIYLLQPQPEKYRNAAYRKKVFQKMFKTADKKTCR